MMIDLSWNSTFKFVIFFSVYTVSFCLISSNWVWCSVIHSKQHHAKKTLSCTIGMGHKWIKINAKKVLFSKKKCNQRTEMDANLYSFILTTFHQILLVWGRRDQTRPAGPMHFMNLLVFNILYCIYIITVSIPCTNCLS